MKAWLVSSVKKQCEILLAEIDVGANVVFLSLVSIHIDVIVLVDSIGPVLSGEEPI
jgi:hypothetical protein